MTIHLTAEQEAQISRITAQDGEGADELAREVFSRGLEAEAHFIAAVKVGQNAASQDDFIGSSEVWAGIEQILQSCESRDRLAVRAGEHAE